MTAQLSSGPAFALFVGTRKGLFLLESDTDRERFAIDGPHFLGNLVHHAMLDPRDGRTLLAAARTGHIGPTVFRSEDAGRSWKESGRPPAFAKGSNLAVDHVFWLAPGHVAEPDVWYAGTSPQGLFRSEDGGRTWDGVAGFNAHPRRADWCGDTQAAPPGGATLHSIVIDSTDPAHMLFGMSCGGVFETRDRGASWKPLNQGLRADFLPDPFPEFGQDVHCMRLHPASPKVLYQQNHCGIYRMDQRDGSPARWERIGENMPREIGDIGFPLALHPTDEGTAWVFPMDGTEVWPRVSPGGKPAAYITRDGGASWQRQDRGLPAAQAWFTVKRQALCVDDNQPVGVYFGTSCGEVWGSTNEGASWRCLASHLPEIFAVEAAQFA
jgi:photosystem II stability/assembly factor-like uncharacterized protein